MGPVVIPRTGESTAGFFLSLVPLSTRGQDTEADVDE